MSKIFVLRINSLVSSVDSTLRFGADNEVIIPLAVIDELQNYNGRPEKKKVANSILTYLETFNINKLITEGVVQENGSKLKIERNHHDIPIEMDGITEIDRRIFQVCIGLKKERSSKEVILVSKNKAIRIKAKALGIKAEDFRDDLFPTPDEQYMGRVFAETKSDAISRFWKDGCIDVSDILNPEIVWIQNMFVEMQAVENGQRAIGRYEDGKIVSLVFEGNNYPYGIMAKNSGQRMLMECLLMDWQKAPLVIAKAFLWRRKNKV